jgi:hypothetical protein
MADTSVNSGRRAEAREHSDEAISSYTLVGDCFIATIYRVGTDESTLNPAPHVSPKDASRP